MSDMDLNNKIVQLIREIHVITGWAIIDDIEYNRLLIEQIRLKLKEDYSNMNFKEITYAFRKYGVSVIDWGKNLNLAIICMALDEYLEKRAFVSRLEEQNKIKEKPKIYTPEELDNIQRQDIEAFYQRCLNGQIPKSIPKYFKEVLVKDKYISEKDDIDMFFYNCINNNLKNIYIKE